MADDGKKLTGMSPYTPLQLQEAGVHMEGGGDIPPALPGALGSGWGGIAGTTNLAPQCKVPNDTSWLVRRYHTRHQGYRRYHYHHAPAS